MTFETPEEYAEYAKRCGDNAVRMLPRIRPEGLEWTLERLPGAVVEIHLKWAGTSNHVQMPLETINAGAVSAALACLTAQRMDGPLSVRFTK